MGDLSKSGTFWHDLAPFWGGLRWVAFPGPEHERALRLRDGPYRTILTCRPHPRSRSPKNRPKRASEIPIASEGAVARSPDLATGATDRSPSRFPA